MEPCRLPSFAASAKPECGCAKGAQAVPDHGLAFDAAWDRTFHESETSVAFPVSLYGVSDERSLVGPLLIAACAVWVLRRAVTASRRSKLVVLGVGRSEPVQNAALKAQRPLFRLQLSPFERRVMAVVGRRERTVAPLLRVPLS